MTIDKKAKTQKLIDYHKSTFDALNIQNPFFVPCMAYKPYGKNELHISLFPSQLLKEKDIYTELINKEYDPDSETRTLYKWRHNKFWSEEYDSVEIENSTDRRYLVPLNELIPVEKPQSVIREFESFEDIFNEEQEDILLSEMTIRDFAAIILRKPVSNKKWINQIIKS